MKLIHITSRANWERIMETGKLAPKAKLCRGATGGNVKEVSAFSGIDPTKEEELLRKLVSAIVQLKRNGMFRAEEWTEDNCVVLEITTDESMQWKLYAGEKKELEFPIGPLLKDELNKIGEYYKTQQEVPIKYIRLVDISFKAKQEGESADDLAH